jgi:hypothetical protein
MSDERARFLSLAEESEERIERLCLAGVKPA